MHLFRDLTAFDSDQTVKLELTNHSSAATLISPRLLSPRVTRPMQATMSTTRPTHATKTQIKVIEDYEGEVEGGTTSFQQRLAKMQEDINRTSKLLETHKMR